MKRYLLVYLLPIFIIVFQAEATSKLEIDCYPKFYSENQLSLRGKFIRTEDNERNTTPLGLKLIKEIEFKGQYCHFNYAGVSMSGKYEIDENFVYIHTGSELGILSLEIINENQLEGEGYIHGTFRREGTFTPLEENKQTSSNVKNEKTVESTTTQTSPNPFAGGVSNSSMTGIGSDDSNWVGPRQSDRIRYNTISVAEIHTSKTVVVKLILTVNAEGRVVDAQFLAPGSTTSDEKIINQIIDAAKSELRYNEVPGANLQNFYYTVKIVPN